MGNLAADSVSLAFSVAGTTADQWNVKVSQIPCSANYRYLEDEIGFKVKAYRLSIESEHSIITEKY